MIPLIEMLILIILLIITIGTYIKLLDFKYYIYDTRTQVLANRKLIEDILKTTGKPKQPVAIPPEESY